jgi:hypothetical protein
MTTSAPSLSGCWLQGVAKVLSTISSRPWALAILDSFGWFATLATLYGTTPAIAALLCTAGFSLSGAVYALVLGRGANDPLGGWLFGLACGFFLWMLVPVALLHWLVLLLREPVGEEVLLRLALLLLEPVGEEVLLRLPDRVGVEVAQRVAARQAVGLTLRVALLLRLSKIPV